MAKRGPRTDAGKAVVRYNALRHGILSISPVLPGIERQEDWQAHQAGIVASLQPEGYFEEFLAGRVALTTWQLMRLTRYQQERATLAQEQVEPDIAAEHYYPQCGSFEAIENHMTESERLLPVLVDLPNLDEDVPQSDEDALAILNGVGAMIERLSELWDDRKIRVRDVWECAGDWTVGKVRREIERMAAATGTWTGGLEEVVEVIRSIWVSVERPHRQAKIRQMHRAAAVARSERLLPDGATLEKLMRYEAHLNRQLYQALHELEAMQVRRRGGQAPLARLEVHGLPEN